MCCFECFAFAKSSPNVQGALKWARGRETRETKPSNPVEAEMVKLREAEQDRITASVKSYAIDGVEPVLVTSSLPDSDDFPGSPVSLVWLR